MDSPEILDKMGDSTLALIEEALKKLYKVHIYTVDDLTLENNNPVVFCREVKSLDIKRKDFLILSEKKRKNLNSFNVVLIRQDPPFNMKYLTATYLLEKIKDKTLVLNNPISIRNAPESSSMLRTTQRMQIQIVLLLRIYKLEIQIFFRCGH